MQIQISAEEVFDQYKAQLAELHHELLLEKIKSKKLAEMIDQYELAEMARVKEAARSRPKAVVTPSETLPDIPSPPALPAAP